MKKVWVTIVTAVATLALLAGAIFGVYAYKKYKPTDERIDLEAWYGVSGDEVAVFYDQEKVEEIVGRFIGDQVYLPLSWVQETLNEKFYWDEENHQLIYTLPESIVYADANTKGSSGSPLFVEQDEEVWLLSGLVTTYTNVRMEAFGEEDVKWIYVDTDWEPQQMATLKKNGRVRVLGGIKSEILTDVSKGEQVEILHTMEDWSEVRTADGHIGYIQNRFLKDFEECVWINTFDEPIYTSIAMDEPVCLVWHQVTNASSNKEMSKLIEKTKGVNVIAPTWIMLTDNQGNYDCLADKSYVQKAHELGMQVWAVVDNFNRGENVQSEILFANTEARGKLIENLMADVEAYDLDGINLDIESIKPEAGPHYVQFIRELSVSCRKNGIVLSVDSYVPSAYTAFYNRAEQGRVADYVVMMGYDEHYSGGDAGSVASLTYEAYGLEKLLETVPSEKLISAMPFYTRVWKEKDGEVTSSSMGIASAKKWIEEKQVKLYWQDEIAQYYGELEEDGVTYRIWMEEEKSIAEKVKLIQKYDLAGAAFWKLGLETESIWDVIELGK